MLEPSCGGARPTPSSAKRTAKIPADPLLSIDASLQGYCLTQAKSGDSVQHDFQPSQESHTCTPTQRW
ncbi:hypothetical protein PC128_g24436 [Phytophthora cactorum]|uniref:Uncharacterized protein n=1 Tax=Phytophthora cactorum TaxID=29920 RepID=A0A8T1B253_9STRA|nr:hypothetical protein PC117_g24176 [Phytophthora cactorum]KAG3128462.1 hypothetical protein C6341_g24547 [Phytophthora cactorum]KAG3144258.1 hypothetical protein PC128_g24436 [Phytophthora cactorum]KAG4040219.1 hypothetical protein PC123_g24237 [Phytophthora cactorum]